MPVLGLAPSIQCALYEDGQLLCGTADQVNDQMKVIAEFYGGDQLDWLFWEYRIQSVPSDWEGIQRYQLEAYAIQIMPRIGNRR